MLVAAGLLGLLLGCTSNEDGDPAPEPTPSAGKPAPEALTPVANQADRVDLGGCVSTGIRPRRDFTTDRRPGETFLVWIRVRVTERVRLASVTTRERSNGLSRMRTYLAPDPGPDSPTLALSRGPVPGPRANDTASLELVGDPHDTKAGRDAAARVWEQRRPLPDTIAPGDHYVFVQLGITNRVNLHDLLLSWSTLDGKRGGSVLEGTLAFRIQCGG
jgi:hypothetical protein